MKRFDGAIKIKIYSALGQFGDTNPIGLSDLNLDFKIVGQIQTKQYRQSIWHKQTIIDYVL